MFRNTYSADLTDVHAPTICDGKILLLSMPLQATGASQGHRGKKEENLVRRKSGPERNVCLTVQQYHKNSRKQVVEKWEGKFTLTPNVTPSYQSEFMGPWKVHTDPFQFATMLTNFLQSKLSLFVRQ